jgi:hypothetical protein
MGIHVTLERENVVITKRLKRKTESKQVVLIRQSFRFPTHEALIGERLL